MSGDKSHVGMSNCYVCGEPSHVLLDNRLQNTLSRNMGPLGVDDLCPACEEKSKTMACLVAITQESLDADRARMRALAADNDRHRKPRYRVFPNPQRADNFLAWVRMSVLESVITGGAADFLVGPVMFIEQSVRDNLLVCLSGVPIEKIREAAVKAGDGAHTDLKKLAEAEQAAGGGSGAS